METPKYNEQGELIRPENYRTWVFVGASLGLSYTETPRRDDGPGMFHNVYIQREAFDRYMETGEFPEKTILAMENFSAGSKVSINQKGYFEDKLVGFEVALKDHEQFEEGWAYFNFTQRGGDLKATAKAFPKGVCYSCHDQHAANDNVFTQFYPMLQRPGEETPH